MKTRIKVEKFTRNEGISWISVLKVFENLIHTINTVNIRAHDHIQIWLFDYKNIYNKYGIANFEDNPLKILMNALK